jgi:hypothetical protein
MHPSHAYIATNENTYDLNTRVFSSESGYTESFDFFAEGIPGFVDPSALRGQLTSADIM